MAFGTDVQENGVDVVTPVACAMPLGSGDVITEAGKSVTSTGDLAFATYADEVARDELFVVSTKRLIPNSDPRSGTGSENETGDFEITLLRGEIEPVRGVRVGRAVHGQREGADRESVRGRSRAAEGRQGDGGEREWLESDCPSETACFTEAKPENDGRDAAVGGVLKRDDVQSPLAGSSPRRGGQWKGEPVGVCS